MKSEHVFRTFHPREKKGFSLIEVICALVILFLVILSTLAVLDYTLKVTVASRNRMGAFAAAERMAVFVLASSKGASNPQMDSSNTSIHGQISINGVNRPIEVEAITYREKTSIRLDRLMKRSAFVTFLKK
ncbi:MAG: prepilin-type N-terminal cleavage/methylation domain-containing protein [Synergistaceae bacterium]|jgi:Tfp pilus assembly protein PilV|nr:prepilin-type N-terminal cleavage/methylation domain-containing protein [Synergistaceae bacterium]